MKDSMPTTFDKLAQTIGEPANMCSKAVIAEDAAKIQSDVFEVKQTNLVSYDSHVKSKLVSCDSIRKIQELCKGAKNRSFPIGELFLGIATLLAGAVLGALASGVPFELGWKGIIFYTIAPAISIGCFVAFCFNNRNEMMRKNELASRILEYLPNDQEVGE